MKTTDEIIAILRKFKDEFGDKYGTEKLSARSHTADELIFVKEIEEAIGMYL